MTLALILIASLIFNGLLIIQPKTQVQIFLDRQKIEMPVDVYVERMDICPESEERIVSQLPVVFETHRQAVIRFIAEMGKEYDKLLSIQFELTDDKSHADVLFRVEDLEPPGVGYALLGSGASVVGIDCDVAENEIVTKQVILHEFYHVLGLGHSKDCPMWLEMMCGGGADTPYPTSLDLMAIYAKYFVYPASEGEVLWYSLPDNVPYVLVMPYNVSLQQLEAQISRLSKENYELRYDLRNDILRIDNEIYRHSKAIGDLNTKISDVEQNVSGLEQKVNSLENDFTQRLNVQSAVIGNMQNDLSTLQAEQSELRATINQLSELSGELKRQLDVLQLSNFLLTILVIVFALAFILSLKKSGVSKK
ncbi:MAG: hypothetical protein QXQ37_03550 [Nitrososphaerota archaeon]